MAGQEQRGFEDLDCYKLSLTVVNEAYRVLMILPVEEKFNLAFQMRKAAVSIVLNIAEGYGRYHYLDCLRFYYIARGSLDKILSSFITCDLVQYTKSELSNQREICHSALRSLNGYIRYIRGQQQGHLEYGDRLIKDELLDNSPIIESPDNG